MAGMVPPRSHSLIERSAFLLHRLHRLLPAHVFGSEPAASPLAQPGWPAFLCGAPVDLEHERGHGLPAAVLVPEPARPNWMGRSVAARAARSRVVLRFFRRPAGAVELPSRSAL